MVFLSVNNKRALKYAGITFSALLIGVLFLFLKLDFLSKDTGGLLLSLALICCLLIAKNIFDGVRLSDVQKQFSGKKLANSPFFSKDVYEQLYKNSPVPYFVLDHEGHVKSSNQAASKMIGLSHSKIVGINIFSWLQYPKLEQLESLIERYDKSLMISDEVVQVKSQNNSEIWSQLSLFTYVNPAGDKAGLLTLVDITKQKKAESAKSEFISLASHQLRTPISGIKWSAELLLVDSPELLTDRQRRYIDRLLISVKRLALLVDDFLRVSRFEIGTFQAEYKSIKLSKIFEEIVSEHSGRVNQNKLIVKTFFDESVNEVVTDANLIRMIVTNLYANAIKYTREGGTIHLAFGKRNKQIVISVADNGIGIPAEDQSEIFSKLFRASNAVRDIPDGTGLGLYIVHEAVAILKGEISFETTENKGTTFEVILPLK